MIALTVTHAFGSYEVGQTITEADAVQTILASASAHHVVKTQVPDPEPAAKTDRSVSASASTDVRA